LCLKIIATVSWFETQKQTDYGMSFAPQNRQERDGAGHTLKFSGLLHVKASRDSVFQSGIKIGVGATADGARGIIVKVVSK
jgi:hypothetical protein